MINLVHGSVSGFARSPSGPVLESATIVKATGGYMISIVFTANTSDGLHFTGAADCTVCCSAANGSAVQLRTQNATDPTGYTWQRSELPVVSGPTTITARFTPEPADAVVSTELLRFMFEGEPECVLYNGVGGSVGSVL
jgi:hypothetical protein